MEDNLKKHGVFIGAIVFLVAALGLFIISQERILSGGEVTILKTAPVDPRDLLRGEYVILAYEIQQDQQISAFIEKSSLRTGDPVFISLKEDARGVASLADVHVNKPHGQSDLWLQGEVRGNRVSFPDIEQYFVPEGAGLPIERLGDSIHAEISLHRGNARVMQILNEKLMPLNPETFIPVK